MPRGQGFLAALGLPCCWPLTESICHTTGRTVSLGGAGSEKRCDLTLLTPQLLDLAVPLFEATLAYHAAGRLPAGVKIQLYFGGALPFGLPPTAASLDAYLAMLEGTALPWMVGVLGGNVRTTLADLAIARGGHVRVGLEDHAGPDQPTNVSLVAEIVQMARRIGRPIASPRHAAELLGLRAS